MGLSQLEICNHALLKLGTKPIDTLVEPTPAVNGTKTTIELCNIFFGQAYEEVLRIYPWNSATKRASLDFLVSEQIPSSITVVGSGEGFPVDGEYTLSGTFQDHPQWERGDYLIQWRSGNYIIYYTSLGKTLYENLESTTIPAKQGWEPSVGGGDAPAPTLEYTYIFGYKNYAKKPSDMIRLINCFRNEDQSDQRTAWVLEGDYILANEDLLYLRYIYKPSTADLEPLATNALITNLAMKLAPALQLDADWASKLNNELYGQILPQARSIDTFENKELLLEESSWLLNRNTEHPYV